MMFILRHHGPLPLPSPFQTKLSRPTPAYADPRGGTDHFVAGDAADAEELAAKGHDIVRLRDGWYEAGGGGVAIWGDGRYWEIRDTPFTVVERSP